MHTVIVSPRDGVLRFMPFALNATVGDTVRFVWPGTVPHSVTMGSELNLCKKNEKVGTFDSGLLNGAAGEVNCTWSISSLCDWTKTLTDSFSVDIQVTTTDPIYYYCSAAEGAHCSKGMWGIINPKAVRSSVSNNISSTRPDCCLQNFGGEQTIGGKMNEWLEGVCSIINISMLFANPFFVLPEPRSQSRLVSRETNKGGHLC